MQRLFLTVAFCSFQSIGAFLHPVPEGEHIYLSADCLHVFNGGLYGYTRDLFSIPISFEGNPSIRFCDDQRCQYPLILNFSDVALMIPQKTINDIFENGDTEDFEFMGNFISQVKLYQNAKLEIYQFIVSSKKNKNGSPFVEIKLKKLNNSFFDKLKFSYMQIKSLLFDSFYARFAA